MSAWKRPAEETFGPPNEAGVVKKRGQPGDVLGQDLMRRFRAYLKDPAATPLDTSDDGPRT